MLSRAPLRTVKDRVRDSKHWDRYEPRPGDVVVASFPKVGTTWTQRIVSLLIFQSAKPAPIMQTHPWVDCRFGLPIEVMIPMLEAQTHRRAMKSHLPFDALPIYDEVKYIHTARGGLDACFSFHNHFLNFTPQFVGNNRPRPLIQVQKVSFDNSMFWFWNPRRLYLFVKISSAAGGSR